MRRCVVNAFVFVLCIAATYLCACESRSRNGWFLTTPEARLVVSPEQDVYAFYSGITFSVEWQGVVSEAVVYEWDFGDWAVTDGDLSSSVESVYLKRLQGKHTARVTITDGKGDSSRFQVEKQLTIDVEEPEFERPKAGISAQGCYITGSFCDEITESLHECWVDGRDELDFRWETDRGTVGWWIIEGEWGDMIKAWFWDCGSESTDADKRIDYSWFDNLINKPNNFSDIASTRQPSELTKANVTFTVTDEFGYSGSDTVEIEYQCPTTKPVEDSIFLMPLTNSVKLGENISIAICTIDPENEILTASVWITCNGANVHLVGAYEGDYYPPFGSYHEFEFFGQSYNKAGVYLNGTSECFGSGSGGILAVLSFEAFESGVVEFSMEPDSAIYTDEWSAGENQLHWGTVGMEDKDGNIVNSVSVDVVE